LIDGQRYFSHLSARFRKIQSPIYLDTILGERELIIKYVETWRADRAGDRGCRKEKDRMPAAAPIVTASANNTTMSKIQSITSQAEWDALMKKSYKKVVVVEFYATW
jgi:hypothetical protein